MQGRPDRLLIYLALALIGAAIASITGPSAGLLTLLQVVVVVEVINLLDRKSTRLNSSHYS